jgi:hypothetical protein
LFVSHALIAQNAPAITPSVELGAAPRLRFSGNADSNSPSVWQRVNGVHHVLVLTSTAGHPSLSSGPHLRRLSEPSPIVLDPWPGGGVWMETVYADEGGTLYGYYHNENVATMCARSTKVIPRIGAARSRNGGAT